MGQGYIYSGENGIMVWQKTVNYETVLPCGKMVLFQMWDKLDKREHIWHQKGIVQSLVVALQGRLTLNHAHPPC